MNYEVTVKELARFLEITPEEAKKRVEEYSLAEAAEKWNKASPKTPEDVDEFYREHEFYLYELVNWNCHNPHYQRAIEPLQCYHGKKILEIGAGIGTLCIHLVYAGNDVTYCDINPTLQEFARQRFEDRGLNIPIVSDLHNLRNFDIIVANDFFEHIHPEVLPKLLLEIANCLKDGGIVYHRSNFQQQGDFPMHYDHSQTFVKLARDANLVERLNGDLVKGGEGRGVQIGVPMLGPMSDEWFHSFVGLSKPPGTKLTKVSSRPADEARNDIIRQIEKDWLFFMDADQTFHPDTLKKLMSWDLPVVSGLYFKSPGNPVPHCYKYAFQAKDQGAHMYGAVIDPILAFLYKHLDAIKVGQEAVILPSTKDDLIECDGVGGGCLLVHRSVLKAIDPPYFQYNEGTAVGEDFYFCRKIQAARYKIFVDPGVICGHRKKGFIGAEDFLHFITSKGKKIDDVYPYPWKEPNEETQKKEGTG